MLTANKEFYGTQVNYNYACQLIKKTKQRYKLSELQLYNEMAKIGIKPNGAIINQFLQYTGKISVTY